MSNIQEHAIPGEVVRHTIKRIDDSSYLLDTSVLKLDGIYRRSQPIRLLLHAAISPRSLENVASPGRTSLDISEKR